jgi:hypothetical protein
MRTPAICTTGKEVVLLNTILSLESFFRTFRNSIDDFYAGIVVVCYRVEAFYLRMCLCTGVALDLIKLFGGCSVSCDRTYS